MIYDMVMSLWALNFEFYVKVEWKNRNINNFSVGVGTCLNFIDTPVSIPQ